MESELIDLFEAAKKAADWAAVDGVSSTGPEVSRCLDALKQLKKFPVTYDMLVATQVGKKLRSLAKHPAERIKLFANELLEIWKKIVIEETAKAKKNGSREGKSSLKREGAKVEIVKEEKVDRMKKVEKLSNSQTVKVEKLERGDSSKRMKLERKESDDKAVTVKKPLSTRSPAAQSALPKLTSMVKSNDPARDKIREILVEALSKVAGEADEDMRGRVNGCDPIRVAVSVETVMFEKMGGSTGDQKLKYRSIIFNMRDRNNPDLRRKVLMGEVTPERLIMMTAEEMASNQRKQEISQIKEKALFDCERGGAPEATTDQFKCGRCGQRKCTYYQMQTRSADEPMTTYVTCVNCNNHWKFC
ncbi:PREDICTED: transcription elongation factor TFIIS-like [Tarenaya hassleriana]|uniref:transcription elongation factor TFIIS-like n=1 Tax=Tarenaya hassleriana TaxID=28532 RepID=UPI00053C66A5|nr:PREDICTED: transcription elongation factor TFIIS-like [Tarenaya hassleriana]